MKVGSSGDSIATRSSLTKTAKICVWMWKSGNVLCNDDHVGLHMLVCVSLSVCLFDHAAMREATALASGGCAFTLLSLQALEWLHKRGRAFCDLKPDNIRVQMGQQPGTFGHVTLIDLGGSVKFKGESPAHSNCLASLCVSHLSQASDSLTTHFLFAVLISQFCCVGVTSFVCSDSPLLVRR